MSIPLYWKTSSNCDSRFNMEGYSSIHAIDDAYELAEISLRNRSKELNIKMPTDIEIRVKAGSKPS